MRQLVQRLSRGVILRRRLPKRFGGMRLFVSPDASLRYWWPNLNRFDPVLFSSIEDLVRPGDTVWDIGANVGLFAFAAAAVAGSTGQVLAVEPDLFLGRLLQQSAGVADRQRYAPVDVLSAAVADEVGLRFLNIAQGGRASNSLGEGRSQAGGVRQTQPTLSVTLDWLLERYPAPQVLKIDVEGLETPVLRGAERLLQTARPRVLCEMGDNSAFELLAAKGYAQYDAEHPPATRQPIGSYAFNTIALPSGESVTSAAT